MLSLFDRTTIMAQPWAEAGYECYCVDLQHKRLETREGNIVKVGADVHRWLPPITGDIRFMAAFPPCTDIATSGARHFKDEDKGLGGLIAALRNFKRVRDMAVMLRCAYLIENPVCVVSTHWRRPDYIFHPSHYGDPYLKTTCLWVGGRFRMPPKAPVEPVDGQKLYNLPRTPDRGDLRSVTPKGFAQAVFKANHRR
jgi:hypothetical protein